MYKRQPVNGPETIADSKPSQPVASEGRSVRATRGAKPAVGRGAATRRRRDRQEISQTNGEERFFLASANRNGEMCIRDSIWNPDIHHESSEFEWRKTRKKGAKWSLSANKCIQRTVREHEDFLSEFESLMAGAQATLEATGMQPRRLTEQEMFLEVKRALNPLTSDTRPYKQGLAYESARAQIANVNIEDEQDGHLKVGGLLYSCLLYTSRCV